MASRCVVPVRANASSTSGSTPSAVPGAGRPPAVRPEGPARRRAGSSSRPAAPSQRDRRRPGLPGSSRTPPGSSTVMRSRIPARRKVSRASNSPGFRGPAILASEPAASTARPADRSVRSPATRRLTRPEARDASPPSLTPVRSSTARVDPRSPGNSPGRKPSTSPRTPRTHAGRGVSSTPRARSSDARSDHRKWCHPPPSTPKARSSAFVTFAVAPTPADADRGECAREQGERRPSRSCSSPPRSDRPPPPPPRPGPAGAAGRPGPPGDARPRCSSSADPPGPAVGTGTLGAGASSIARGVDQLAALASAERLPDVELDRILDEPDGAVAHRDVHAARMSAAGGEVGPIKQWGLETVAARVVRRERVGVQEIDGE